MRTFVLALFGRNRKIQRQISYWAATAALYSVGMGLLWGEVLLGGASARNVTWLWVVVGAGLILFYGLIRCSEQLALKPSQLAALQGYFAIVCIVVGYAIAPPVRGATLSMLLVDLVFCAFAMDAKMTRAMSVFAIVLLGLTMTWLIHSDPLEINPELELIHFLLATCILLVVSYLAGESTQLRGRLQAQKAELAAANEALQRISMRDALTDIPNRRSFDDRLKDEWQRALRHGWPLAAVMIDIDNFKSFNEAYGHQGGDACLRRVAQALQQRAARSSDLVARYGGEEFVLLLPHTNAAGAQAVAERLRQDIASLAIPHPSSGPAGIVTISAGVSIDVPKGDLAAEDLIARADRALYDAKRDGRNCVRTNFA